MYGMFDRLCPDGEDRISFEACMEVLEKFSEQAVDRDAVVSALERLHGESSALIGLESSDSASNGLARGNSMWSQDSSFFGNDNARGLTFDDFLFLMGTRKDLTDTSQANDVSMFPALRSAFMAFGLHQEELEQQSAQARHRNNRLVFLT